MKKYLIILLALVVTAASLLIFYNNSDHVSRTSTQNTEEVPESAATTPRSEVKEFNKNMHSIDKLESIWLIVNKSRPISANYYPNDLVSPVVNKRSGKPASELMLRRVAATALQNMFRAASESSISLELGSAFRDYAAQGQAYNYYVSVYGQEQADTFSAKPGTSEHQTGLAADISGLNDPCWVEVCFGDSAEGKWVSNNAHKHGFIVRYPKNKQNITGYQYEPWHIRYVGKELAKELYTKKLTMEEFFEL